jgi:hypothetical protein
MALVIICFKVEVMLVEFSYDDIVAFMERYITDYSAYGQDPETQHLMNEYWADDIEFIPYLKGHERILGREQFKKTNTHPPILETLTVEQLVVDDRRGMVDALVKTELRHKATGEVRLSARFNAIYQLKFDENKALKIEKILFFFECKPETANVTEILYSE